MYMVAVSAFSFIKCFKIVIITIIIIMQFLTCHVSVS